MDVDPLEYTESPEDEKDASAEKRKGRLNALVAITVAVLATFMGICKVKDDNIVQQMQQDQAKSIDAWAWYQAKKTRIEFATATLDLLEAQASVVPPAQKALFDTKIAKEQKYIQEKSGELKQTEADAKAFDKDYDAWNIHDDQFDMSDAALAIAISLLALTSLTQKRWLFGIAMVPTIFGLVLGLAGLFGWGIHPQTFAKWLGT